MAEKRLEVVLSEEILEWFGWQEKQAPQMIKEALLMELVRLGRISSGKAAELLGVSRWDIYDVMARYEVPAIQLSPEELKKELRPWKEQN
jgi:predicted HTH domain antitoxin